MVTSTRSATPQDRNLAIRRVQRLQALCNLEKTSLVVLEGYLEWQVHPDSSMLLRALMLIRAKKAREYQELLRQSGQAAPPHQA